MSQRKNEVAVPYCRFPSAGASMFVDGGILMFVDVCVYLNRVLFLVIMLSHPVLIGNTTLPIVHVNSSRQSCVVQEIVSVGCRISFIFKF